MSRTSLAVGVCLPLLLITSGCYTTVAVNFGNGTPAKVRVQSAQTGQETEVAPDKFKRLRHSSGALVVTTQVNEKFKFQQVSPFDVDRKYHTIGNSIFGPNSVTLNLRLETNMQVYVVMPGKKSVDERVAQPKGYPKAGEKLSN
jgi:hypothetical protein